MKRTDFTFRKAWMIYTVYFFLLFTPTANAQQTASLVNLELKNEKLSAALKQIEKMGGKNILFAYEETENYHVTASIRKQTQGEVIRTVLKGIPQRMILFTHSQFRQEADHRFVLIYIKFIKSKNTCCQDISFFYRRFTIF